ncbi:MAG: N-formylglutamate amidohydrolase [Reyranella sp.]|uniref:N-formylglutamate amidohydrolase n=1 Tax=Reyranella sp. TaxID=1929291 RepID=UPI00121F52AC|nr:N-formylglutamate amidohydrolase [Reyranella sp.]TAJ37568.1 MAG: N-formylglutamate amidohydrolase [Reyranella sp.]
MDFSLAPPDHEALDCRLPTRQTMPLVVASPHSGSNYPAEFLAQAAVPLAALRRAEDAFVDELFGAAPSLGVPLLAARFPRSYVDANREPYELDPAMFEGPLPRPLNHRTTRVAAGLGMIPRLAASGEAIYRGRVPAEMIEHRLEACWRPYHLALSGLVEQTYSRFGAALLIDAHSMPSSVSAAPVSSLGPRERDTRVDVVLGDNHGESCAPELVERAEHWLAARGLRVLRNQPYAGGFTTQRYGRPGLARHALQIEINRALYMDEARHERLPVAGVVERLMAGLLEEIGNHALEILLPRPLAAE